jgi:hypothetical protein
VSIVLCPNFSLKMEVNYIVLRFTRADHAYDLI